MSGARACFKMLRWLIKLNAAGERGEFAAHVGDIFRYVLFCRRTHLGRYAPQRSLRERRILITLNAQVQRRPLTRAGAFPSFRRAPGG